MSQEKRKTDEELVCEFFNAHPEALFAQLTLAALRKCSEGLLERERWSGGGPRFLKIGRLVRYKKSDVLSWLNAQPCCTSTSEYADALPKPSVKNIGVDEARPL